jgi:2-polyprenyl-6-methoxyphenol hydroxylase-like FAD-dependent oxidoreductase
VITVVGGGVAGLTAALALAGAGFDPEVIDSAPASRSHPDDEGLLHVNPAGQRVLALLGVEQVASAGFPVKEIALANSDGEEIGRFPAKGGDYRYIPRFELVRLLERQVKRREIPIRNGCALLSAVPGSPPLLTFADDSTASPELVVGADGVRSTVRGAVDPTAEPHYTGQWFVHGVTNRTAQPTDPRVVHVVRDGTTGHAFGWTTLEKGTTRWWLRATAPSLGTDDVSGCPTRDRLIELAPGGCPGEELMSEASGELAAYNAYAMPRGVRWSTSGVVLVGDSAHACSPAASQSSALAAEDALTLAIALRDNPRESALENYVLMRRARAERAVAAGDPRRGLTPGPDFEVDWNTTVTRETAQAFHERYTWVEQ